MRLNEVFGMVGCAVASNVILIMEPIGIANLLQRTFFETDNPGGMKENSPAFQRWDGGQMVQSPIGTAEPAAVLPSRWDLFGATAIPSVETLGYSRLSLRDTDKFVDRSTPSGIGMESLLYAVAHMR
jgi:hypothetical protein